MEIIKLHVTNDISGLCSFQAHCNLRSLLLISLSPCISGFRLIQGNYEQSIATIVLQWIWTFFSSIHSNYDWWQNDIYFYFSRLKIFRVPGLWKWEGWESRRFMLAFYCIFFWKWPPLIFHLIYHNGGKMLSIKKPPGGGRQLRNLWCVFKN